MEMYDLPTEAVIRGRRYPIRADFRAVLRVIAVLNDPGLPALFRYYGALALFYRGELPPEPDGWEFMSQFVEYGQKSGERLMDWRLDADAVLADVGKVAGQDVRTMAFLHWWSFLALFQSVGQGQLSLRVGIRDKLRRGQKLEGWEREYFQANRDKVVLPRLESFEEKLERERLERLLDG